MSRKSAGPNNNGDGENDRKDKDGSRNSCKYGAEVEYDGSDFAGFQVQVDERTVQGELESTLERLTGEQVRVTAAGRTDSGVHAMGQVITFEANWRHPLEELQRAMNALLPRDIVIRNLTTAQPDFHPRFDAKRRYYRYVILNAQWPSPLSRRYTHHVSHPLDLLRMQKGSDLLVGEHDFAAFGHPPSGDKTTRHVYSARWSSESIDGFLFYIFEICANAFLYRMVRNVVGTLIRVGTGEIEPEEVKEILESKDRRRGGPPAPPQGLCLVKIEY